ncbi:MAG TPA: HAMP domain-containing sensor histidine kinase, partial [Terriglobales bacterium]|nr:HAMP domain-containing sensor histidine kinase [Terriglobales bacterium]
FDTVFMVFALSFSGGATPDFYIACFLTLVLSCVCDSTRGLLIVTVLAPLIYAYVLFNAGIPEDPSMYLRLPFPFVIAIFYGYFAQVERLRKQLNEKQEEADRERRLAEEVSRQRDRLRVLHEIFDAVNSTLELDRSLNNFLDRALEHVPYKAACVQLTDEAGSLKLSCYRPADWEETLGSLAVQRLGDRVVTSQGPAIVPVMGEDPAVENSEPWVKQGLNAYLGVPLIARDELLGVLAFFAPSEAAMARENIEFVTTLADQAANAIQKCRLYEKIRHQAAELGKSNKIKDEFLGVVSHELKTPLNVISGYTNMLIEGMMGETAPIQEKALQTILRQSNELHGMINSLLQVSSIDAEAVQADYIETDFWEFLYELKCCYDYAFAKDVQLAWDFPPELPRLYADRGKLKHILQNLINNAVKFTERGQVRVSARYLSGKRVMEFKISDTGIGIPEEALTVIFEKFRQVDSSESRAHGGTGLGLYIVKRFTQLLEGTVHVESKPGTGSTFTVRIPCPRRDPSVRHEQLTLPVNMEAPGHPLA